MNFGEMHRGRFATSIEGISRSVTKKSKKILEEGKTVMDESGFVGNGNHQGAGEFHLLTQWRRAEKTLLKQS